MYVITATIENKGVQSLGTNIKFETWNRPETRATASEPVVVRLKLLIHLVREILRLFRKSQGKDKEFQNPTTMTTMSIEWDFSQYDNLRA